MKNEMQLTVSSDDKIPNDKNIFNQRSHKLNKYLLYASGLWFGLSSRTRTAMNFVLILASVVVGMGQIKAMVGAWGKFNLFVECITPLATNILGALKLCSWMLHSKEMEALCDQMQMDWDDVRGLPQESILLKRGEEGRLWTVFYFIFIYVVVCGWIATAFSPKVMDALIPLNYSRRRFDLFPVDFMVDPDDYFYTILISISVGLLYSVAVNVAIDTLYMVLAQHVCAMFEILRYNLHHTFEDDESTHVILKPEIHEDMHYSKIISCIKKHKAITEYIKSIEATCEWKLLGIVGLNMLALSFTGYMVIAATDDNTTVDTLRFAFFGLAQVFHLFCITLPGHWIMESSSFVPNYAYSCRWYMMSQSSRKLILFLIRASIEPCKITAGKIYVLSVENFSGVLQTSMSYLTMLNSVQ